MRLRLFYFAPSSIHTTRWLSAFVNMGHVVHLATTDVDFGNSIPGVIVHDMNVSGTRPGPTRFMRRWKKVRNILREVRPDVVHGHSVAYSGEYAAYFRVRPLLITAWGSDVLVGPVRSRLQRIATRWRLRQCDLVTVDSSHLKQAVINLGVSGDRIVLIQWGANVERIRSFRGSPRLRQLSNVPQDAFVVLSTRRFEPIYNLETILRAIPKVLDATKQAIYFVFIGGGSLHRRLESLAKDLGVDEHVRFIGDLAHQELEECYGGADVYVSVPQSDSTSVSLLEALTAGLPVVVSDVQSNLEWVRNGWNGYIVPRGDDKSVADAINSLIGDEPARRAYGGRSQEIAMEKADHIANMRKMEELYLALVRSFRRA
jgi:glycosyltransferase involved in cell wall biosynthesis